MKPSNRFKDISYLKSGNSRQKRAYEVLTQHEILTALESFDPILTGTIPINIDIETSDLDIVCYVKDKNKFKKTLFERFDTMDGFKLVEYNSEGHDTLVAVFWIDEFKIEIFGQNTPTEQQNAYRHMLIEHDLLKKYGATFRAQIIELKKQGLKTEPAFARALGLNGDPYNALLKLGSNQ